jgi:hypothetical protein
VGLLHGWIVNQLVGAASEIDAAGLKDIAAVGAGERELYILCRLTGQPAEERQPVPSPIADMQTGTTRRLVSDGMPALRAMDVPPASVETREAGLSDQA